MATAPPSLVEVVASLEQLGVVFWRWPGGRLALWPPVPDALAPAVRAHKPALLDLADARGAVPPEWAREPDAEGWYRPPTDHEIRLLPDGALEIRPTPAAWEALLARVASYTDEEKRAICEAAFAVDVEPWDL